MPLSLVGVGAAVGSGLAVEYALSGGKATAGDYVAAGVTSAAGIGLGLKALPHIARKGRRVSTMIHYSRKQGTGETKRELLNYSVQYFNPEISRGLQGVAAAAVISGAYNRMMGSTLTDFGAVIESPGGGGRSLPNQSRRSRRGTKKAMRRQCSSYYRGKRCTLTKGHLGRHSYGDKK